MRKNFIPRTQNQLTGRYNSVEYLSYPWYIKPTFARRWGPKSWLTRLVGRKLPGDDGNIYAPEGWTYMELGPETWRNKGADYMKANEAHLNAIGRGSCPFSR